MFFPDSKLVVRSGVIFLSEPVRTVIFDRKIIFCGVYEYVLDDYRCELLKSFVAELSPAFMVIGEVVFMAGVILFFCSSV